MESPKVNANQYSGILNCNCDLFDISVFIRATDTPTSAKVQHDHASKKKKSLIQ